MLAFEITLAFVVDALKALAAPIAAVLIAQRAIVSFRKQTAIERRIDWYEKMHRQLLLTGRAFARAGHINDDKNLDRLTATKDATEILLNLADEAWMYADKASFHAVQRLAETNAESQVAMNSFGLNKSLTRQMINACYVTANVLAAGFRKELLLDKVKPLKNVTRTTDYPSLPNND